MRLPNENTIITDAKLNGYLLNAFYPRNLGKARLFAALGYSQANWQVLARDLREQHLAQDVTEELNDVFGRKYAIIAEIQGPAEAAKIKSIWQIDYGTEEPRFITAYPAE